MNLKRHSLAVTAVAALLLTGCGGADDADSTPGTGAALAESATDDGAGPRADAQGSDGTSDGGDADLPPRPTQDECVGLDVPADGRYTVYDAGQAVVSQDGQRLVLGDVQAAPGWSASIDDRDNDEVEVEFRSGPGEELDLKAEIEDGRLKAEICADDD